MKGCYRAFLDRAREGFLIPGLKDGIVPQGIDYRADKEQFYITGYKDDGKGSSVIMVVDGKSGVHLGTYFLFQGDGSRYTGHVGGITVTPTDVFITSGKGLGRVALETIDQRPEFSSLKIEEKISIHVSETNLAYCSYDREHNMFFAGNFYYEKAAAYRQKGLQNYKSVIFGYKDLKSKVPDVIVHSEEDRLQGVAVAGGKMFLSQSYGRFRSGNLLEFDYPDTPSETISIKGQEVPVMTLEKSTGRKLKLPPMSEGITVVGQKLYILFESGATKYKNGIHRTGNLWFLQTEEVEV